MSTIHFSWDQDLTQAQSATPPRDGTVVPDQTEVAVTASLTEAAAGGGRAHG